MSDRELSHLDENGRARMVDVGDKPVSSRAATARAELLMRPETLDVIREGRAKKGDVLAVAQVAAVMAAKRTPDLIPLCHPIVITGVAADFEFLPPEGLRLDVTVTTSGQTGVEMEALTAASIGALTVYDMCKAIDRDMRLTFVGLLEKSGGKSGQYVRGRG